MPDAAAFADPQAMLREMAGDNPRLSMLMDFMQASQAAPAEAGPDERDEVIACLSEKLDEAEIRLARARQIARRLHEAQQLGADRLGRLAAALGACGACWGDDPHCPACRGRGRPGMVRPDPQLRAELLGRPNPQAQPTNH